MMKNIVLVDGGLRNYMENISSILAWWTAKIHEKYCPFIAW
jgi:hypothetical protein